MVCLSVCLCSWIPAFAGMTSGELGMTCENGVGITRKEEFLQSRNTLLLDPRSESGMTRCWVGNDKAFCALSKRRASA